MKKLTIFSDKNKKTMYNLFLYSILDKIDSKCEKWFQDTFINEKIVHDELLVDNLKIDLDYLFTQAIVITEDAEKLGIVLDSIDSLEFLYREYTEKENGYRFLVKNRLYHSIDNRLLTEKEAKEREDRAKKRMMEMLADIN